MKALLLLIVVVLQLTGCSVQREKTSAIDLVTDLMEVWETGDQSRLAQIVDSSAVYDDVPNDYQFEGVAGFEAYVGHVHNWASDVSLSVTSVGGNQNRAYAEWVMTGRQSRPIRGRIPVATDSTFTIKGLTLVEVSEGKIVRAADYIDVLGLVLQLGSTVELPGGVIIGSRD